MATYHFTIKTDKKKGGGRVKALNHVEYIQRQGAYTEDELERRKEKRSINNIITSDDTPNIYKGQEALLYTSQYGEIHNTLDGLQVKYNPSIDTISIALMVAKETMNAPLVIKGSRKFKEKCVKAAVESELDIQFADHELNKKFMEQKEKEELENAREQFRNNGGRIVRTKNVHKSNPSRINKRFPKTLAEKGTLMSKLSERNMASDMEGNESEDGTMLLQSPEHIQLDNRGTIRPPLVRWDIPKARRRRAVETAQKIVKNIERSLDEIFASSHVEYINREKAFAQRGGCIYHAHHLPQWAKDDPVNFFKAADRYEGKGNIRYREIEFALPNELTLEQDLELIQKFIDEHLSNHYYAFAIHDKIGMMTNGIHNTHVHLMFTDRLIDECEAEKERTARKFFSYPKRNAKTLDEKRMGGAPKDRKWSERIHPEYFTQIRESFATITNEILEKYGYTDRVDHRSLKAQRQEAIMNGDTFLAQLLDRIPEKTLSPEAFLQEGNPEVEKLKIYRSQKNAIQNLLFQVEQIEAETKNKQILAKSKKAERNAAELIQTIEFNEATNSKDEIIVELKKNLIDAIKELNKWQSIIITNEDAEKIAKFEMMTEEEREQWANYTYLLEQETSWKNFLNQLSKSPSSSDEKTEWNLNLLKSRIAVKLQDLSTQLSDENMEDAIIKIELSFDQPEKKAILQRRIAKILFNDKHAKEKFNQASEQLASATELLRQVLFEEIIESEKKDSYTRKELYDIARKRFWGLKKEIDRLKKRIDKEQKKVISHDRAIFMAKDVLTNHGFRDYREKHREYERKIKNYNNELAKLRTEAKNLSPENLMKRKQELVFVRNQLEDMKLQLNSELNRLEKSIDLQKVHEIADGILRKNSPQVKKVASLKKRLAMIEEKYMKAKEQLDAMRKLMGKNGNPKFRVKSGGSGGTPRNYIPEYKKANTILDAILGKSEAVQSVEISLGKNDRDGMKDWTLMTELDKDDEMEKIWRRNEQ